MNVKATASADANKRRRARKALRQPLHDYDAASEISDITMEESVKQNGNDDDLSDDLQPLIADYFSCRSTVP